MSVSEEVKGSSATLANKNKIGHDEVKMTG